MTDPYAPRSANHVPLSPIAFLHRTADVYPDRDSIVYGDRRYDWQTTRERCACLASALGTLGIDVGDTVSVLAFNTPEMIEAHFGVPMAGAVLNTINTRLDADTIGYILAHGESRVLLVDRELLPVAREAMRLHGVEPTLVVIEDPAAGTGMAASTGARKDGGAGRDTGDAPEPLDYESLLSRGDPTFRGVPLTSEWQTLALNYTSGTTGRPKGVLYHHRGAYLMSLGTVAGWALPMHPVYLYSVPLFHCNGWGHAWTMAAMAGTLVCLRAVDPARMFALIGEHRVTHFGGAPIVLNMLANAPAAQQQHFAHEVQVMTAGAPPPAAVIERMGAFNFRVMHVYGLTETYGHVLQAAPQAHWSQLDSAGQAEMIARQGVCFPMTEAVDVLAGDPPVPVPRDGETLGEIVLRGNTVMKGYLKNPEATEEALRDGWFWTGDLAVIHPDGYVQVRDRAKDIIISGGENISSVEIEACLYRHPAVAEAAVVAMPDDKWGEVPCAFVTLREGSVADEQALIDHVASQIARFKKPKRVVFGELPKTATGKIQKFELRERARQG